MCLQCESAPDEPEGVGGNFLDLRYNSTELKCLPCALTENPLPTDENDVSYHSSASSARAAEGNWVAAGGAQ